MTQTVPARRADEDARLRRANRRTAMILFSISLVFFAGIIASKFLGGTTAGITVVGCGILLYLVMAIGRNLRSGK